MRRTLGLAIAVPVLLLTASAGSPAPPVDTTGPAATAAIAGREPDDADEPGSPAPAPAPAPAPVDRTATADAASPSADGGADDVGAEAGRGTAADGADDAVAAPATGADDAAEDALAATFVVAAPPAAGGVAGTGPRVRYTVEVAPTVGADPAAVAAQVRAALHDPRSWARDRTLEQVGDPSRARIRVVLADPATVDVLCGRAGLDTAGIYSCWNGRFAALNAWRWEAGAEGFDDLATYRTYLVNHEFGHGLGRGHVGCPSTGAIAPVMMQQSKGLAGCRANGWPYPSD